MKCKVGDYIRIVSMEGEPQYSGREGTVTRINRDPWGDTQIHGTWGGCCLYEGADCYEILD